MKMTFFFPCGHLIIIAYIICVYVYTCMCVCSGGTWRSWHGTQHGIECTQFNMHDHYTIHTGHMHTNVKLAVTCTVLHFYAKWSIIRFLMALLTGALCGFRRKFFILSFWRCLLMGRFCHLPEDLLTDSTNSNGLFQDKRCALSAAGPVTCNTTLKIERLSLTTLASTLGGFLLTHEVWHQHMIRAGLGQLVRCTLGNYAQ